MRSGSTMRSDFTAWTIMVAHAVKIKYLGKCNTLEKILDPPLHSP